MPMPNRCTSASLAIREKALGPDHPDVATVAEQSCALLSTTKVAMPMPSRCTSARWRYEKKHLVPIIPMLRLSLNNLALLYHNAGSLCRCGAAVQAVAGDQRESAWSRSSRCCGIAEQSGGALQRPRSLCRCRAVATSASLAIYEKSTWSRSSRCCNVAEQSGCALSRTRVAMPMPSRCTSGRWQYARKALGPDHPDVATVAEQSGCSLPQPKVATLMLYRLSKEPSRKTVPINLLLSPFCMARNRKISSHQLRH